MVSAYLDIRWDHIHENSLLKAIVYSIETNYLNIIAQSIITGYQIFSAPLIHEFRPYSFNKLGESWKSYLAFLRCEDIWEFPGV